MNNHLLFKQIKKEVGAELNKCSAHNFDHVMRVYNMALAISDGNKIDADILKIACLLHDIGGDKETADSSGHTDHAIESSKRARKILKKFKIQEKKIKLIQDCIVSHRYRNNHMPKTLEAKILFDADKLDSLGAIGIARAFIWVGKNKAHIYKKSRLDNYARKNLGKSYNGRIMDKSKHSPQLEYETKMKYLPKKLYTPKAKKIGQERLNYFKKFLIRLEKEINGEL